MTRHLVLTSMTMIAIASARAIPVVITILGWLVSTATAFSMPVDRFRATCPADPLLIQRFDPALQITPDSVWVAVFRTSAMVRDEFLQAMQHATTSSSTGTGTCTTDTEHHPATASSIATANGNAPSQPLLITNSEIPVAVARVTPSKDFPQYHVLDNMRCLLKKETTDPSCEGGSEHTEALCVAIDSLLLHYLQQQQQQNSRNTFAMRTKSTIVTGSLLEERGFLPVDGLHCDMATHIGSLEVTMSQYATRALQTSHGARERALQILALLAQCTPQEPDANDNDTKDKDDPDDGGYDPWANVKSFF